MNGKPCPQMNLMEALHDGRLGPTEQASCERHVRTCASCAAFQAQLLALRADLREPAGQPTPLEHQRARLALLRAAVGAPRRAPPQRRWALALGLLLAASAMAGVAGWKTRAAPQRAPLEATSPVPSATRAPEAGPTVQRGRDISEVPASDAEAPVVPSEDSATAEPPVHEAKAHRAHRRQGRPARPALAPAAPDVPPPPAPPPVPELPKTSPASADFAAAMAALGSADFGLAAARFRSFSATYPTDPRGDEAEYFVVVALQRAGRSDDAQDAALHYLQRHPHGAHRAPARKIAGPSAP